MAGFIFLFSKPMEAKLVSKKLEIVTGAIGSELPPIPAKPNELVIHPVKAIELINITKLKDQCGILS